VTQTVVTGVVTSAAKYAVKYQINDTEPVHVGVFGDEDPIPKIRFEKLKDLDDVCQGCAELGERGTRAKGPASRSMWSSLYGVQSCL
jgi:hypothetical protein